MKFLKSCLLVFTLFGSLHAVAQESSGIDLANTLFVGYPAFIFDVPDFGIYLGYNAEIKKKDRFSWEGQASISYSSFKEDDGTFAHDGGETIVGSLLFGPRLYLMKPEKNTRLYFSVLPGVALVQDNEFVGNGSSRIFREENLIALGFSLGSYLQFKEKIVVGVSFEQYGSYVFKAGYKF